MCIVSANVPALVANHFLVTHPDVRLDIFDKVAEMDCTIGIGQGGCDKDFSRHGARLLKSKARFYRELAQRVLLWGKEPLGMLMSGGEQWPWPAARRGLLVDFVMECLQNQALIGGCYEFCNCRRQP
jgi:hypothetical protein